jgi:hypothetical protein
MTPDRLLIDAFVLLVAGAALLLAPLIAVWAS